MWFQRVEAEERDVMQKNTEGREQNALTQDALKKLPALPTASRVS